MPKIRKSTLILCAVFYSIAVVLCFFFVFDFAHTVNNPYDDGQKQDKNEKTNQSLCEADLLCFIPHSTLSVWNKRDFFIVFGIPSIDIPTRRWRRHMQRSTCWQFPEVATRHNNYNAAMLVLYILARHPINNFTLSEKVKQEAEQWKDILTLPMNEGRPSTNKLIDGKGSWGLEAEVGSCRKTFFWFQFALSQFPRVPFIAKGDDDVFLRVPQYLVDLRRLPLKRTYWGGFVGTMVRIDNKGTLGDLKFAIGYCVTLSRDVAEQLVSYEPLRRIVSVPYSKEREPEFMWLSMFLDDVMIARALNLTGYSYIFFAEPSERFLRGPKTSVTKNNVVVHRPTLDEYNLLMKMFSLNAATTHATVMIKRSPRLVIIDLPRGMH